MTDSALPSTTTRVRVCHVSELAPGHVLKFEHGERALAIYNVDGQFYATDDACTHGPGSLAEGELTGDVIECNFHGGQFNVRTGAVAGPPCLVPIRTYPVTVEDGQVFVAV
jgi:nitrite reductase/ring-hydroxylating ferredoxin subunit